MPYENSISGMATTYTIVKAGSGAAVSAGNTVVVHATGVVGETGKKFWSTKDPGTFCMEPSHTWMLIEPRGRRSTAL